MASYDVASISNICQAVELGLIHPYPKPSAMPGCDARDMPPAAITSGGTVVMVVRRCAGATTAGAAAAAAPSPAACTRTSLLPLLL